MSESTLFESIPHGIRIPVPKEIDPQNPLTLGVIASIAQEFWSEVDACEIGCRMDGQLLCIYPAEIIPIELAVFKHQLHQNGTLTFADSAWPTRLGHIIHKVEENIHPHDIFQVVVTKPDRKDLTLSLLPLIQENPEEGEVVPSFGEVLAHQQQQ